MTLLTPAAHLCPLDADVGVLAFEGPDARAFLQAQMSNDAEGLTPGRGQWTTYNSPKGRVLANFWLGQAPGWSGLERYDALLAADLAAAMHKRLTMFVLRAKVAIVDRSKTHRVLGVVGAGAATALAAAFGRAPAPGETLVPEGFPAEVTAWPDGRFAVLAANDVAGAVNAALAPHVHAGSPQMWRAAGVAAGVPWISAATTDQFVAQMMNWDALAGISFTKGCYPGQEVVARMRYLGRLKERLYRLHADAPPPAPGVRLFSPHFDDQPCGTVVNAAPAAGGGTDLLAVVQMAAVEAPGLALAAPDGPPLERLSLPYALPDIAAPRGRLA